MPNERESAAAKMEAIDALQNKGRNFIEVAALLLQPEPANTFSLVVVLNLKRNDG